MHIWVTTLQSSKDRARFLALRQLQALTSKGTFHIWATLPSKHSSRLLTPTVPVLPGLNVERIAKRGLLFEENHHNL
jgi:hypothetical protein